LFAPLVVLALAQRREWRALAGTAAGGTSLLSAGWLLEPGWLASWLSVRGKTEVTFQTPTVWGLAYDLAPAWWPALGLAFAVLVVALCGAWVFRQRELGVEQIVPLAVGGSLLVTPYVWAYEHALLLLPLALLFAWMDDRKWAWLVWISGTVIVPWALYWVAFQRERDTLSSLLPLLVAVVFVVFILRQRRRQGRKSAAC
jgi:NADH:ubiquinone oxidoreductase subunit 6 (subunit J)